MTFGMTRPCVECPFLTNNNLYLHTRRAEEIAQALEHSTFACHMTLQQVPQQHCAGALVIMARANTWGDMQQIAERIGLFDSTKLDLAANVFESFTAFARFYGGAAITWARGRSRA
jgi:hypothetical protein